MTVIQIAIERGAKRAFASALEWPGWCRSGKTEEAAVEALVAYASRFAVVAAEAGLRFPKREPDVEIVDRVAGNATTDFGAPATILDSDFAPVSAAEARRHAALVSAAWKVLDDVVAVSPAELRKGPRGGGRDRDKMVDHVLGAEVAYARKLGVRHRQPQHSDAKAIAALRADIVGVLGAASDGRPPVEKGWPPRYAARRIAWHVVDHAWEMEDRRSPV